MGKRKDNAPLDAAAAPEAHVPKSVSKKRRSEDSEALAAPSGDAQTPVEAFCAHVSEHSAFFDHLVSLVPARFYLAADGEPESRFKHGAGDKAKAKLKAKENSKKAKRLKLDPTQAKDTVAQQQARAERDTAAKAGGAGGRGVAASDSEDDSEDSDEEEEADGAPAASAPQRLPQQLAPQWRLADASGAPGGKEELAQRLQRKIEAARARRRADEQASRTAKAKQWREAAVKGKGKGSVKGSEGGAHSAGASPLGSPVGSPGPGARPGAAAAAAAASPAAAAPAPTLDLQFGRFEGVEARGRREKKAKRDRLAALAAVEAAAAAVAEVGGRGSAEGQQLLTKQSWGAALARASGEKVLDDPKLLKKSIKRAAALKERRTAVWQERVEAQTARMETQQQRRKDNLQQRTDEKVNKRIERREKKLLRPGFEGRKGGEFLNK